MRIALSGNARFECGMMIVYGRVMTNKLTDKRISELADRMCVHLAWGRNVKALLIAQYIRRTLGYYVSDLKYETGQVGNENQN